MCRNGWYVVDTRGETPRGRRHERATHHAARYTSREIMRRVTLEEPIQLADLRQFVPGRFRDFVKAVIDLRRQVMILDADMHADQEAVLLAEGSRQRDLWGINLYPQLDGEDWLEFDSMINMRPSFGNRSRGVDDATTRDGIRTLVSRLVRR